MTASSITNYTTGLKWLYEHTDHERLRLVKYDDKTFSLDRMRKLLDLLGNPHEQLKAVQIAGTKGKGSTCAMLSSMLEANGFTTGLYTSPHLVDLRERITINRSLISYNDMAELFKQIASVEDKFGEPGPTFFEIMTAAALLYFAEQAVDVAVLETGLGGRLDCVTAVNPIATGVTQISLDHTQWLGDDLPSIAREKAGIFKKGVPAFSVDQPPEVAAVLKEVAEEVGCPLKFNGKDVDFSYRFEASRELGPHTRVCLATNESQFDHLAVPLPGEHQAHNCGLALALLDSLKSHGFAMAEEHVVRGLAETTIAGRMEQVWSQPRVIIDGAHNAASIQALIKSLGAHINYDSLVIIFGTGLDKDVNGMLKELSLGADKLIFTRAKGNPRAVEPDDLLTKFGALSGKMAQTTDKLADAIKLAGRAVSRDDLIVVTGSFYLAGEARKLFADAAAKRGK
ncbi:bifunctional folylpolyglutamate synthase/dihydrofolate synthase [Mucisphaera calidilacus]|uniref:Dihydrofolate synthase/folylpolyglutamate synthase n=1 Tax=Mucisphaera calidilacus TaxID=2527982 RepID=A0A518BW41_9BACT|nr:folylpolyglutamate synthase/dihydrofolate synthase family protein [Mucisphaera calidilacus]QDU71188.1 Folylpolyglutamate synthase [Mucisphaera calidilacus]